MGRHTTGPVVSYRCEGRVRGSCGVRHRTVKAAKACIARDDRAAMREHGPNAYTDRRVVGYVADTDADGEPIRPYEWTRSELHTYQAQNWREGQSW